MMVRGTRLRKVIDGLSSLCMSLRSAEQSDVAGCIAVIAFECAGDTKGAIEVLRTAAKYVQKSGKTHPVSGERGEQEEMFERGK